MIPEPQLTVTSALTRKVYNCIDLSDQERRALAHEFRAVREFNAHVELPSTTDSERGTLVILKGFACRYRVLFNGHREIVGLLLPGDLSEPCAYAQTRHPYSIASLSAVRAAWIGRLALAQLLERMPGLNRLLWQLAALEQSIAREWIQNVGRRTARERLAHLLCEIFERQRRVGLVSQGQCDLPMTQVELGDALALSAVHVNRMLMDMKRQRLITVRARKLIVHDREDLYRAAGFDPAYLNPAAGSTGEPPWQIAVRSDSPVRAGHSMRHDSELVRPQMQDLGVLQSDIDW